MFLVPAVDDGCQYGHHCCQRMSPDLIKQGGRHKHVHFYFNLWNQLNLFNDGLGTNMRKAAQPSGGVDSLNPRRWRDGRLHHLGCGVYWIGCVLWIDL